MIQNPFPLSIGVGRTEILCVCGRGGLASSEMTSGLWTVVNSSREQWLENTNICFKFPCFSVNRTDGLKLTAVVHSVFVQYRTFTCYLCMKAFNVYPTRRSLSALSSRNSPIVLWHHCILCSTAGGVSNPSPKTTSPVLTATAYVILTPCYYRPRPG